MTEGQVVVTAAIVILVIVETRRLGPLEKGFPSKRQYASAISVQQLQPVFYGLWLLSATGANRVDCRVKFIGESLADGGVTNS